MSSYSEIITDVSNFAIVVFGFCVSLYTLLYSFILGKIDILRELSEGIKNGEKIVNQTQKESNYIRYIRRMRMINKYNIYCLWFSLIVYLLSILIKYLNIEEITIEFEKFTYTIYIIYFLAILAILLLIFIGIVLIFSLKIYKRNTKV